MSGGTKRFGLLERASGRGLTGRQCLSDLLGAGALRDDDYPRSPILAGPCRKLFERIKIVVHGVYRDRVIEPDQIDKPLQAKNVGTFLAQHLAHAPFKAVPIQGPIEP